MAEKMYTPEEVAEHLHLKVKTVLDFLRAGKLPGVKIGKNWRIPDSDLQTYIDGLKASRGKRS